MSTCEHKDRPIRAKGLCAVCYNKEERYRNPRKRKYIPASGLRRRNRYRYGLEPDEYYQMFVDQNNKCFCCGKEGGDTKGTRLHVDHDHKTGKVRKLLCNRCNYIAGAIEDERYSAVVEYLKSYDPA